MLQKHKPETAKRVPWNEIEDKFEKLGHPYESMLALVKFIRRGNLDKKLFAYTSMHKLVVSIYEVPEWNREALHIELNTNNMRWCFEYRPKPYEPSEMIRYCDEDDVIATFYKYIKWLKW